MGPSEHLERWRRFALRPIDVLRGYRRQNLRPDAVAGLTVAIVAVPQCMAYAAIAGLPPSYGLYTAAVASIVGALWGSSSYLSTGPTNASSLLVLAVLLPLAPLGTAEYLTAASMLAVLVGVLRLVFGAAGLGMLVNFASRAVLLGFIAGAGVLIAAGQLQHVLGLTVPPSASLFNTLSSVVTRLDEIHLPTVAIGLATIAAIVALNRWSRKIPGPLLALCAAGVFVAVVGADRLGVQVVGAVARSLPAPTSFSFAFLAQEQVFTALFTGALAITALGLAEAISIARELARQSGERLDVDQELIGQGAANIAAGLLSGYPASGSFTRSAVSFQSGGRSALAGVFTGVFVLLGILAFGPLAAYLPRSALAGVIFIVAYKMVDRGAAARVLRTSRAESAVMVVTFVATLTLPLEFAVLSGVILSLAVYIYQSSMPVVEPVVPDATFRHFVEKPGAEMCPQLAVVNVRGALFFGAASYVEDHILELYENHPGQRHLLLRMHGVHQCDLSGVDVLEGITRLYREAGGDVWMVQVRPEVREIMRSSGFEDLFGADHHLPQEGAIEWLFDEVIDPAVCCYECDVRVFAECQALTKHPYDHRLPPVHHGPIHPRHHLSVPELADIVARSRDRAIVIDVREPEEYRLGHLPGARLVPLRDIIDASNRLPRDRSILLVCRSGRRSTRALHWFLDLGFEEVFNLKGGILSWKAQGQPLEVE
jgi:SulP family sulfate permease